MKFTTVLKQYLSGEADLKDLKDSDDLIYEVKTLGLRNKTQIIIWFDDLESYFNLFDLDEYDISAANKIFSNYYYGDYLFFDSYAAADDLISGRIFGHFNEENIELLRKILRFIAPELSSSDLYEEDVAKTVIDKLEIYDKRGYINDIASEYQQLVDSAMSDSVKETITEEYCDLLEPFMIVRVGECFEKYITSVGNLNRLYQKYGNNEELTLKQLLKKFTKDISVYGDFYGSVYEVWKGEIDNEAFNSEVSKNLDRIYDDVFENFENNSELPEIVNFLGNKFGFGKFFEVPGKSIFIRIDEVNPEDNTIAITVNNNKTKTEKKYSPDIETFMSYLYNHDLFELGVE